MERSALFVRDAVTPGSKKPTAASVSRSISTEPAPPSGTVGIADGRAGEAVRPLSAEALAYAKERGLSASTLERLRVGSGTASFHSGRRPALFFPHFERGDVVGWKARALGEKEFTSKKGGRYGLWNIDQALGSETIYITEGEIDACSLVEAGVSAREVVSVPNGAKGVAREDEARGYQYVFDALAAGLSRTQKFVLVTDADGPGRALRADLARILGPARCWFVDFPAGIKDANEFLVQRGGLELLVLLEQGARPWPIEGLYRLSELPEPPPMTLWRPRFPLWTGKLAYAPGMLSVVTGNPGHGKTTLQMQVWCDLAEQHDLVVAVASFETRAKPHHRRAVRQFRGRVPERLLSAAECAAADAWNDEHFLWLQHPGHRPTLQWVLDTAEAAVVRHGARVLQIDPWNKLESAKPADMRETDYIGQCLDELAVFARDMNCHVQVLAHPAKIDSKSRGRAPYLEDISGSKNWDNKCDLGIVVHRPKMFVGGERQTGAQVWVRKVRYEELGHPCRLPIRLNLMTGLFEDAPEDDGGLT